MATVGSSEEACDSTRRGQRLSVPAAWDRWLYLRTPPGGHVECALAVFRRQKASGSQRRGAVAVIGGTAWVRPF